MLQFDRVVRPAAFLTVSALALLGGCAEKAVQEGPQDIEKSRQEHIQMKQRELGQTQAK